MVKESMKFYLIENDHKLAEYCAEQDYVPNNLPLDMFMSMAEEVGWVFTPNEYEAHHNTRTLPKHYYLRIV